jgi:hypothetical protein
VFKAFRAAGTEPKKMGPKISVFLLERMKYDNMIEGELIPQAFARGRSMQQLPVQNVERWQSTVANKEDGVSVSLLWRCGQPSDDHWCWCVSAVRKRRECFLPPALLTGVDALQELL